MLSKFEECPRAYEFQYVRKVKARRIRTASSFLGSRVHEVLERLHEDLKNGRRNSLKELLNFYGRIWEEKWSEDVSIPDEGYSPEHYRKVGRECIENYYGKHAPFDQDRTVGTEFRLFPIVVSDNREYTFQGVVDRLALLPDGRYEIHDYKTSKNLPTQEELEKDRQLALYQLGVQQKYLDADDVELVWHYLRFGKDFRMRRSPEELDALQRELVELVRAIELAERENDFPTMRDAGAHCDSCDYRHLCPEWRHLFKTEALPEDEFLGEDGVVLVDELTDVERKLSKLGDERSELKERRKKLKEAISNYAEREGVSTVYGTEKRASVMVDERVKFPRKGEEGREELERLIKESGRWNEVSSLRLGTLKRIARNEEWSRELLAKLDKFRRVKRSVRVKLEDLEGNE